MIVMKESENLEDIVVFEDIANYIEGNTLGYNLFRFWRKFNSSRRIMEISNEFIINRKSYLHTISAEDMQNDFLSLIKDFHTDDILDCYTIKKSFCLGILTKTSEKYYDVEVDPDFYKKENLVKIGMGFTNLAKDYVRRVVEAREPIEFGNNGKKAVIDIAYLVGVYFDLFEKYTNTIKNSKKDSKQMNSQQDEKDKKKSDNLTANQEETTVRKSLFDKVGGYYTSKGLIGKNLFSFVYGFTLMGLASCWGSSSIMTYSPT